jgi:hypothetical protein
MSANRSAIEPCSAAERHTIRSRTQAQMLEQHAKNLIFRSIETM